MAEIKEKNTQKEPTEKKVKAAEKKSPVIKNAEVAYAVLLEPWITEKSHSAMAHNRYTFKVVLGANKKQVKKAIEGLYSVTVEKVAITNIHSKKRNFGRHEGTKAAIKKAIITIKEGQSIELFKGA